MTPTSDERREVAARLRKAREIMAFVDALGIDPDGDWCWNGCNVCGYPFGINRYPGMGMPSTIPRYCPYCGTRQDVHYCKEETPDVDK